MISEVFNEDNMIGMARYPDKFFNLAIVDPPYGIGDRLAHAGNGRNAQSKFTDDFKNKNWDNAPPPCYFDELFRVSKNQIIWGGNYFHLPPSRGFICWDKMVFIPTMSRIEFAWTSFDLLPQLIKINNTDKNRIHLTQKPIALYSWLLKKYAKQGDKILDTHLGSGSSRIAAYKMGFDFWGYELDVDYFNAQEQRFKETQGFIIDKSGHIIGKQTNIFDL